MSAPMPLPRLCIWCRAPVPKGRQKFCTTDCLSTSKRLYVRPPKPPPEPVEETFTACVTCDAPLSTSAERQEGLCSRHHIAPECVDCGATLKPGQYKSRCRRCQQRAWDHSPAGRASKNAAKARAREARRHPCADCGKLVSVKAARCQRHATAHTRTLRHWVSRGRG